MLYCPFYKSIVHNKYCFLFTVAIVSPQLFINNSRAILFSECVFPRLDYISQTFIVALTIQLVTRIHQVSRPWRYNLRRKG